MKKCNPSISAKARQELALATRKAGRELGVHSTLFHGVIAERLGLNNTDMRAWDLLVLNGPMSHGKFAQMIGLSGGAATAVIDRLERARAVARQIDPDDRRKIIVKVISSVREGWLKEVFRAFEARVEAVLNHYSDEELEASRRLMQEMGQLLLQEATRLRSMEQDKIVQSLSRRASGAAR